MSDLWKLDRYKRAGIVCIFFFFCEETFFSFCFRHRREGEPTGLRNRPMRRRRRRRQGDATHVRFRAFGSVDFTDNSSLLLPPRSSFRLSFARFFSSAVFFIVNLGLSYACRLFIFILVYVNRDFGLCTR